MSPLYLITILVFFFLAILSAVILAFLGIRGRLTLGQPRCRRCTYQLGPRTSTSDCCPECGMELADKNALRFDARVRSKTKIFVGLGLLLLAFVIPISAEIVRFMMRDNTSIAMTGNSASLVNSTLMKPIEETPKKQEHWEHELDDVSSTNLIIAAEIRPTDWGIWNELNIRSTNRELSDLQLRTLCETYMKVIPRIASAPRGLNDGIMIIDVFEQALNRFDPEDESDTRLISSFITPHLIMDQTLGQDIDIQTNRSHKVILNSPWNLPSSWTFKAMDAAVELRGDDEAIPTNLNTTDDMITINLPAISHETTSINHTLSITPSITIASQAGKEWKIQPRLEFPINLVRPGEIVTVYNEVDELHEGLASAFAGTQVFAWSTSEDSNETLVSIEFIYAGADDLFSSIDMTIEPDFPNSGAIQGGNFIAYSCGDGWTHSSSHMIKTYRVTGNLEKDTLDITLEPRLKVIPNNYEKRSGLLGTRVRISDLPIQWVDRPKSSTDSRDINTKVTIERIGRNIDEFDTSTTGPLFGPTPMTSSNDLESTKLMASWLEPALLIWTSPKGERWAQLHYGSSKTLPINSMICISVAAQDAPINLKVIELTPKTTSGFGDEIPSRGNHYFKMSGDDLLPGTTAKITFSGIPACLRRDHRQQEKWYGGSFTLEIPVIEGEHRKETGSLHPIPEKNS